MRLSDPHVKPYIRFLLPIRNMNWLIFFIWGGFTLSGIRTLWTWGRLLAGERSNIDLPGTHGSPIDGAIGLVFYLFAALLLWITFKTPELRQYWVMSVALSLILISWGCEQCFTVFLGLNAVELAFVIWTLICLLYWLLDGYSGCIGRNLR